MFKLILILSVLSIVCAVLILRKAIRDAREYSASFEILNRKEMEAYRQHINEPEEHSIEMYDDIKPVKKFDDCENSDILHFKDYNNQDKTDLSFFNKCQ